MAVMQASEANINFVKTRLASPDGKLWGKAPGMVLLKPTSIAHSGTSASVGANGQVTFTAVTSLSLNGVFSADFDNYVLSCQLKATAGTPNSYFRMRSSGTDDSGNNYTLQYLFANSTTVSASRATDNGLTLFSADSSMTTGYQAYIYGPYLAQPTAFRSTTVYNAASVILRDNAGTHNQSTSYDGFTFFMDSNAVTGALQVYGVRS